MQEFKYLGRIVLKDDDDRPAFHRKIKKARQQQWARFSRLPRWENADDFLQGHRAQCSLVWLKTLGGIGYFDEGAAEFSSSLR